MSGKHAGNREAEPTTSRLKVALSVLSVLAVLAAIGYVANLTQGPGSQNRSTNDPGVTQPGGGSSGGGGDGISTDPLACPETGAGVVVDVSPDLAGVLRSIVRDRDCPGIEIRSTPSVEVRDALASGGDVPDVWVPESSLWLTRTRTPGSASAPAPGLIAPEVVTGSLAASPVVIAAPPAASRSGSTWREVLADPGFRLGDPLSTTPALAPLVGARTEVQTAAKETGDDAAAATSAADADLAALYQRVQPLPSPALDDAARLASVVESGGLSAVSEQTALSAGLDLGTDVTLSVPLAGTLVLDYPAIATATAAEDRAVAFRAAAWLGTVISTDPARKALTAAGFRSAQGDLPDGDVARARALRLPAPDTVSQAVEAWSALVDR